MLNQIVSDLKFISEIPTNAKPNFSDKTYTLANDWFCTWKRRLKSERGENGVIYVDLLIDNIEKYWRTWLSEDLKIVRNCSEKSRKGFEKLVQTYCQDSQTGVAQGYQNCWERIKKWLAVSQSEVVEKKFFNYAPRLHRSEYSGANDK
jgi:hypothetical protein